MPVPTVACGPLPDLFDLRVVNQSVSGQKSSSVVRESNLWDNSSNVSVSFLDGTASQQAIVKSAFAEYSFYANINFVFVAENTASANIRVTFATPEVWSAVGKLALNINGEPTMSLGSISQTPSEVDRAIVLHEVGHALGLMHEWDGKNVQLKDPGNNAALAQQFQRYNGKTVSNFPYVDTSSVMSYFLPASATQDGKGINASSQLSKADKGWLTINYPGRSTVLNGVRWNLLQALDVLKVPLNMAALVLSQKDVAGKRAQYAQLISSTWNNSQEPTDSESQIIGGLNASVSLLATTSSTNQSNLRTNLVSSTGPTSTSQNTPKTSLISNTGDGNGRDEKFNIQTQVPDDATQILAAIVLHPTFREAITNIVEQDLTTNHGIKLSDYPIQAQASTTDTEMTQGQNSISDQSLPPDVQQGIFDVFTSVLKNPIFTNVVTGIVKDVVPALIA
ncbi:hypothetical protein VKT23_018153 [Stygiomarasmius scandens]|uniref:Peptidase metallopeptidase domain-containing protein n=1 Tax=Marasmiellus scandens TaxID=2682957 RepID=A0ABR1IT12_9AGAR